MNRVEMMLDIYPRIFESPIEAAKAYDEKAAELFGDFAFLNFERG